MKVLIAILLPLALVGGNLAQAADIPDEQVVPSSLSVTGDRSSQYGVFFEESIDTLRMPTLLYGYNIKNNQQNAISFCKGLDDPACSEATGFKFYALFQPCITETDVDCIESVYAITPGSPARTQGKFVRAMPSTVAKPYKGDVLKGLPNGGNAGIWNIPGVKNKGGSEDYAVIMSRVGDVLSNGTTSSLGDIRAVILPVKMVSNAGYKANVAVLRERGNSGTKNVSIDHPGTASFEPCAIVEDGTCALRQSFPDGVQFGMAVRFSKSVNGWLHGRISAPQIDYQVKSYGTRIDMQGLSTKVPVVGGYVPKSAFTDEVKKTINYIPDPGSTIFPGASGENSMRELTGWAKLLDDKAIAYPSQWIFYNLPEYQMQSANQCIRNSSTLAGFVTTSSTAYAAGPPVFNKETQSLDYKVASAHKLKDGSVFKGEYNLYIDSKVARCIYQFSSAPISANISIVGEAGEAKIATTTVRESGGWLHLSAFGFTFSSPTLKVKLSQNGDNQIATPAPAELPATTQGQQPTKVKAEQSGKASKLSSRTITCIKGKTSKKVTGSKPVCPAGFKKK
jgi:hypothetical protein